VKPFARLDQVQYRQRPLQGFFIEEFDAGQILPDRAAGRLFVIDKVEKVAPDVFVSKLIRRALEITRQQDNGGKIALLGFLGIPVEL